MGAGFDGFGRAAQAGVDVAGTPFTLQYDSTRMPGNATGSSITIPLSDGSVPDSLLEIRLQIEVAGQINNETFEPAPNLSHTFDWDGKDAYGRFVGGVQPVNVTVDYVYNGYTAPPDETTGRSFGRAVDPDELDEGFPARETTSLTRSFRGVDIGLYVRVPAPRLRGFGGWSLSARHELDPRTDLLRYGDGSRRRVPQTARQQFPIQTVAGVDPDEFTVSPEGCAVGPDGSLYVADRGDNVVTRLYPDGTAGVVAGTGRVTTRADVGEGEQATSGDAFSPIDVAVTDDGTVYYLGQTHGRIHEIDGTGKRTTVAGTTGRSTSGSTPDDATGTPLDDPTGLAAGPDGSLYVTETGTSQVHKVDPEANTIETVAGNGTTGNRYDRDYEGDGTRATRATLAYPGGVAVDDSGTIYVADGGYAVAFRIEGDGSLTTVAGDGDYESDGDGGPATDASFRSVDDVSLAANGDLLLADSSAAVVRRVDGNGTISTVAGGVGTTPRAIEGPATAVQFSRPRAVAGGTQGFYVADLGLSLVRLVGSNGEARRVLGATETIVNDANGIREFHAGDGGPATEAAIGTPDDVAVADDGTFYFCDRREHVVRAVDPSGTISTCAGEAGQSGYSGDGGQASSALLARPTALTLGDDGTLYIAEEYNHVVRAVRPDGSITTVAGTGDFGTTGDGGPADGAQLNQPTDLSLDGDGNLYVATAGRIRRIGASDTISTVVGGGSDPVSEGAAATSIDPSTVRAVTVSSDGTVYFGATQPVVWRIGSNGRLQRHAGTGDLGYSGDGNTATEATLRSVRDLELGPNGSVYVADSANSAVRRVESSGTILTAIGGAGQGATPPNQEKITDVQGIAVTGEDTLYVADRENHAIRTVTTRSGAIQFEGIASTDGSRIFRFHPDGRHDTTVDALTGETLYTFEYDDQGRLTGVTDVDGATTTVERTGNGSVAALVGPDGQRTELAYDADGYLSTVTDPAANEVDCTYGNGGLLTDFTDRAGRTTTYRYDADGEVTETTNPAGETTALSLAASARSRAVTVESPAGRTETMTLGHDSGGLRFLSDVTGATLLASQTGSTLSLPDGDGVTTTLGADPRFGEQAPVAIEQTTTSPSGRRQRRQTSRSADMSSADDALSHRRLTTTTTVDGRTTRAEYEASSREVTTTYPEGGTRTDTVDAARRLLERTASDLGTIVVSRDGRGRATNITATAGGETHEMTTSFGTDGYASSVTDAAGNTTSFSRDPLGRPTEIEQPDGRTTTLSYDATGTLTSVTPPGRPAHTLSYDDAGRPTTYEPPGSGTWSYDYDADGFLTGITGPSGDSYSASYNDRGQPTQQSIPRGTYAYTYTAGTGNLRDLTGPDGATLSWQYDGRLVTEESLSGPVSGTVSFDYDDSFRLTGETVDGTTVRFDYDDDGNRVRAGAESIQRDAAGYVTGTTLRSTSQSWTRDGFGLLETYRGTVGGTTRFEVDYTTDALGRVTETTETVAGSTTTRGYDYDVAGRLTTVRENGQVVERYEYDDNDNRTESVRAGTARTATYDDRDRVQTHGDLTFDWDGDGRLTKETDTTSGEETTYDYDLLGNLQSVSLSDGTSVDYVIDPAGRRVGKRVDGSLTRGWLYGDGLTPVAELNGSGTVTARFVYGTSTRVPDYVVKGGSTYAILSDHLGSPRLVVDADTGQVAQRLAYDASGRVVTDTNPGFQPFGFAGGLYDPDTGLVRFGMRDYDPRLGRWTAPDPLGFAAGSTNRFSYAGGDPVNAIDPDGQAVISGTTAALLVLGGMAIGGGVEAGRQYLSHGSVESYGKVGIWSTVGGVTFLGGGAVAGAGYGAYTTLAATVTIDMAGGAGGKIAENALARSRGQCVSLDEGVYSTAIASGVLSGVGGATMSKLGKGATARKLYRLKATAEDMHAASLSRAGRSAAANAVPVTPKPSKNITRALSVSSSPVTGKVATDAASKVTPNAGYSAVGGQCRGGGGE